MFPPSLRALLEEPFADSRLGDRTCWIATEQSVARPREAVVTPISKRARNQPKHGEEAPDASQVPGYLEDSFGSYEYPLLAPRPALHQHERIDVSQRWVSS